MSMPGRMSTVRKVLSAGALILTSIPIACGAGGSDPGLFNGSQGGAGPGQGGAAGTIITAGSAGSSTGAGGSVAGKTATLSGRVMAPSGAFPVSGALVYIGNDEPEPIPMGVYHYECDEMYGTPYALSKADGSWTIENVPVGKWKLITRKGNFRRIRDIEVTEGMDPVVAEEVTTLPGTRTADNLDITPSFAVVKTDPDLTYNLLAKFGMGQVNGKGELVEGTESFHIYEDDGFGPYPHTSALFENDNLKNYHMVFLPCFASSVGVAFVKNHVQALRDYVAAGGRIYNSCTVSLWSEATFPEYVDFYEDDTPNRFDIGRRTSTAYETKGTVLDQGLADWMKIVSPGDTANVPFHNGYVTIDSTKEVSDGHGLEKDEFIVKPYTWVKDNDAYPGSPLMVTYNYDFGKVFYSVYETSSESSAITPQEYVLLYVILEVGVCENLPPDIK